MSIRVLSSSMQLENMPGLTLLCPSTSKNHGMVAVKILTPSFLRRYCLSLNGHVFFQCTGIKVRHGSVPHQCLRRPRQCPFHRLSCRSGDPRSPANQPQLSAGVLCRRGLPYDCAALAMSAVVPHRVDCRFMQYYLSEITWALTP